MHLLSEQQKSEMFHTEAMKEFHLSSYPQIFMFVFEILPGEFALLDFDSLHLCNNVCIQDGQTRNATSLKISINYLQNMTEKICLWRDYFFFPCRLTLLIS